MWEKAKKFFHDLWLFKRRKDARGKAEVEENIDDEELFSGNEEDENPGNTRLNEGTHRKAPGFKRSVMVFAVVAGVLIFLFAYMSRHSEKRAREERPPQMGTTIGQEPANITHTTRDNSGTNSYPEYLAKLRESETAKNQNPPSNGSHPQHQPPNQGGRQNNTGGSEQAGRRIPTLPTFPTSALPQAIQAPVMSEEELAEKAMADRYKSPIAFSVNGGQPKGAGVENGNSGTVSTAGIESSQQVQRASVGVSPAAYHAPSNRVIQAGTLIPAMLFSGINTDAPGQVVAQIMADVYDTATNSVLLIPAGSRIIGMLDTASRTKGSGRVGVVFSTLLMPDGGSYALGESLVASDSGGYNGIQGKVNRHTERVLSGGAVAAGLAALGSYASGNTSTRDTYTGGQLAMQGAMASLLQTSSDMFKDAANVEATVTIKPGYEFNVCVVQAISFEQR